MNEWLRLIENDCINAKWLLYMPGRQIDGVWHTGVVVYGEEFFYGGGMGIQSCRPVSAIYFHL